MRTAAGAPGGPGTPTTLAQALTDAKAMGVDRLDAQLLLARLLDRSRTWLLAHDDMVLDAAQSSRFRDELVRRASGEPLAYLLGEKEFHGLLLSVDANVLVPRPETELLVDWALELLENALAKIAVPRVVDLGTGSGAIAVAVKHAWRTADITATDASAAALQVARANAARLALNVAFASGSWWDAVPGRCFDLVLSNPPYIAGADSHLAALTHEPLQALTPGGDGLDSLRAIVAGAARHLEQSGWLLLEHGYDQARMVQAMLREQGFEAIETRRDLAGLPRCTGARRVTTVAAA